MTKHHLPGVPPIPLTLRRSGRARRISLRISHLDGRVTLTLPNKVPEAEALSFAASKESWIRRHLSDRPQDVIVDVGAVLPIEGTRRQVVSISGRRIVMSEDQIGVPDGRVGIRLQTWLRELARDRLTAACDGYAKQLGRPYQRITLRDTRSRWGSCTSDGGLMFSWRLIMASPAVLNYVAAHEVAHLAEMNHSPAFWSVVEKLYGPHKSERKWLRGEGNSLHRFRFESSASN